MQESSAVREAIERFYKAFTDNDVATFETRLLSGEAGITAIGSAPHEWHEGPESFKQEFGMPGVRLEAGDDLRAWAEGSVGWTVDRPSFLLPDGSSFQVRMTTVFHQEDGDWKIVQLHASVGIADEEAVEAQAEQAEAR
jgi:hypothetical protein